MPLRPGVARLMNEALINNMPVAVCSTSSEDAVNTVVLELLGSFIHSKIQIFAGDVVAKKVRRFFSCNLSIVSVVNFISFVPISLYLTRNLRQTYTNWQPRR